MVRRLLPDLKKHDFLYLSFLAIVSSGFFTLLLFVLYCWYDTGTFPLLHGIPASVASQESARFWIGSIYVPVFLAFAGIAIAHRLLYSTDNTRRSSAFNDARIIQMTHESDSRTLKNIMDMLNTPGTMGMKYHGTFKASNAGTGWKTGHLPHQPSGHYGMSSVPGNDYGPGPGMSLTIGSTYDEPVQAEDAGLTKLADQDQIMQEVDPLPLQPDSDGMTGTYADDHNAGSLPCASPGCDENMSAEKNEPVKELDIIEQLKDPAKREKLVALLTDVEI